MASDSDKSQNIRTIGIECESLETPGFGVGRIVRKLLEGLAARDDLRGRFRFVLYSNGSLPDDPLYEHALFEKKPCGMKPTFGSWAPRSFSLYYFVLLPIRLLFDRPNMMFFANYMLPVGTPVKSLVVLTDDIFRETHNPLLKLRYRIAYRIYATFWAKRFATRVMAISHSSVASLVREGISEKRISVNPLGVPLPVTTGNGEAVDFLFVGQSLVRRRLKETLDVFARIADIRPGLTFRFIGIDKYPTPTIAPLIRRINDTLGREAATWQERVDDRKLANAYRSARSVVYISDVEAFGMPPLEGLSYGATPIVADTPINREIYGDHAYFVPMPITLEGISQAMLRSLDDVEHQNSIISAGPGIIGRYSWQAHADRFVDIVSSMTA